MTEESPVLDTLTDITAVSLERCKLDPREFMMARIAALVAVDAPAASYLFNTPSAIAGGVTVEDVQGVLIAVAPVVGTPRIVSAATRITEALGFAIDVLEAEEEYAEAEEYANADGKLAGVSS
jgi:alkylhydroperoxidase/carboxymuconolactone decarboxylase family protein YurZ